MEMARAFEVKGILLLALMLVVTLILPYRIYETNGNIDLYSILLFISFDIPDSGISIQFLPSVSYILPALLICTPCILWFSKSQNMSTPVLLGSAGGVLVMLISILLVFLPSWEVIPWLFHDFVIALFIPEFIDLNPFAGLAFTTMVFLPLMWKLLSCPQRENRTRVRTFIAAGLAVLAIMFPLTIESRSWQGTDINRNFFEGFSLFSVTSTMWYSLDGNRWGYGTSFYFSMSSIYEIVELLPLVIPGIIFAWFASRQEYSLRGIVSMVASGIIHLLLVWSYCIWINETTTHAGTWIMSPLPVLLIGGVIIAMISGGLQWIRKRDSIIRESTEEIKILHAQS